MVPTFGSKHIVPNHAVGFQFWKTCPPKPLGLGSNFVQWNGLLAGWRLVWPTTRLVCGSCAQPRLTLTWGGPSGSTFVFIFIQNSIGIQIKSPRSAIESIPAFTWYFGFLGVWPRFDFKGGLQESLWRSRLEHGCGQRCDGGDRGLARGWTVLRHVHHTALCCDVARRTSRGRLV